VLCAVLPCCPDSLAATTTEAVCTLWGSATQHGAGCGVQFVRSGEGAGVAGAGCDGAESAADAVSAAPPSGTCGGGGVAMAVGSARGGGGGEGDGEGAAVHAAVREAGERVAGKREVGGGGRGGEGGGRWRGRACAKEGGARETSATSATVTRGVWWRR